MELFYTIVLAVAVIVLIILLTYVGILMQNKQGSAQPFPPIKNTCPDKWTSTTKQVDGDDVILCEVPKDGGANKGSLTETSLDDNAPAGYVKSVNGGPSTIDFNHDGWTAQGMNVDCAKKAWANKSGIVWDGITNYNMC